MKVWYLEGVKLFPDPKRDVGEKVIILIHEEGVWTLDKLYDPYIKNLAQCSDLIRCLFTSCAYYNVSNDVTHGYGVNEFHHFEIDYTA